MSAEPLQPHQECSWPQGLHRLERGEVLLVAEALHPDGSVRWRQAVSTWVAPALLPPLHSEGALRFRLRAISAAELSSEPASVDALERSRQELKRQLLGSAVGTGPEEGSLESHLQRHFEVLEAERFEALRRFEPIDGRASLRLGAAVEAEAQDGLRAGQGPADSGDPLRIGVNWLLEGLERDPIALPVEAGSARQRLERLLEVAPLRSREVVISLEALQGDCGPLVAFHNDDPGRIALLRSAEQGYWIWEPQRQARPRRLDSAGDALREFSPRMLSLLPCLQPQDLSLWGMLHFAYGKSGDAAALIAPGLILGGVIGFLLAIGREVGAVRWIFGRGGLGGLLGLGLALVSPGFRLPILATVFSTGLGLLIPTFNTILTNQALPDRDLNLMLQLGSILLAGALAGVALDWARSSGLLRTQIAGTARLEFGALDRLLQLPVSFFGTEPVGSLSLRFQSIRALADGIRTLLADGLLQALLSSIYLLFMLRVSVKLTLLAVVLALLLLVPTILLALDGRRLERKAEEAGALAMGHSLELISAVSKLRLAGAEPAALRWWSQDFRRSIVYEQAQQAREATGALLETITPHLGTLLLFITITRLGAEAAAAPSGALAAPNIGQLLGFLSAFGTFIGSMAAVAGLARKAVDLPARRRCSGGSSSGATINHALGPDRASAFLRRR